MQKLLTDECDMVYECKYCRALFRSFPNFITHKRFYCKIAAFYSKYNHSINGGNGFSQDGTKITQKQKEFMYAVNGGRGTPKNLSAIVDDLRKQKTIDQTLGVSDFYDQVADNLTEEEVLRKNYNLNLEQVPNTSAAVYQTHASADVRSEIDTMKTELLELRQLLEEKSVVMDDNGQIQQETGEIPKECIVDQQFRCRICE